MTIWRARWLWWQQWWQRRTLLNRETMDENIVPAISGHLLNLGVHLKHLQVVGNGCLFFVFIIIVVKKIMIRKATLLPISLIFVLKLAISRTESAISPVAKFWTTFWHTLIFFSSMTGKEKVLKTSSKSFQKSKKSQSPHPVLQNSSPDWLGSQHGIFSGNWSRWKWCRYCHLSRSLPHRTILLSSSTFATWTAYF